IPQSMFIIGGSGSGKSTLLRDLYIDLKNGGWTDLLHIFDGKQFFCSQDIIDAIEASLPYDDKRRIVIIDDIDFYFKRSSFDDQYRLRSYLSHESAPLLIATLSGVTDALANYKAPFFEGVRIIYIPPFNPILHPTTKSKRLRKLLEYLPPVIRSFKIASDIIAKSNNPENDLNELLNLNSPLYRNKLNRQPVYSQRILYAIANTKKPATLSELRKSTGLPSGTLSTYLRQLSLSGDITKTESKKIGSPYEICDPLFKLWLSDNFQ
ncbi:MAG: hypothetical protein K2M76_00865, partial [Muribaculaceae bacterium]|nr:hypothetical protein [Muribaculaceae bacterium]